MISAFDDASVNNELSMFNGWCFGCVQVGQHGFRIVVLSSLLLGGYKSREFSLESQLDCCFNKGEVSFRGVTSFLVTSVMDAIYLFFASALCWVIALVVCILC